MLPALAGSPPAPPPLGWTATDEPPKAGGNEARQRTTPNPTLTPARIEQKDFCFFFYILFNTKRYTIVVPNLAIVCNFKHGCITRSHKGEYLHVV